MDLKLAGGEEDGQTTGFCWLPHIKNITPNYPEDVLQMFDKVNMTITRAGWLGLAWRRLRHCAVGQQTQARRWPPLRRRRRQRRQVRRKISTNGRWTEKRPRGAKKSSIPSRIRWRRRRRNVCLDGGKWRDREQFVFLLFPRPDRAGVSCVRPSEEHRAPAQKKNCCMKKKREAEKIPAGAPGQVDHPYRPGHSLAVSGRELRAAPPMGERAFKCLYSLAPPSGSVCVSV